MTALTTNEAVFLGTVLEGFFYGIYCLAFILYLNLRDPKRHATNLIYPLAGMFILCTSLMCIDFTQQFLNLFRKTAANRPLRVTLNDVTSTIYVFVDTISQCVLIYRCWVMWGRNQWLLIVPSFLTFTSFATGITLVIVISRKVVPDWVTQFYVASFSISLAVNSVVTGLLILKLVLMLRESSFGSTKFTLRRLIPLIFETGLLTFIGQLTWVVLIKLGNPGLNTIFAPLTMIYGLTPTIVIVRVILGRSFEPGTTNVVESALNFATRSSPTSSSTVLGIGKQEE